MDENPTELDTLADREPSLSKVPLKTEEIFGAQRQQQHIKPKDLPVPKLRRKIRYKILKL